jgi:hypothetical protein
VRARSRGAPASKEEHEFLTRLNDRGEIKPDLLTGDDP